MAMQSVIFFVTVVLLCWTSPSYSQTMSGQPANSYVSGNNWYCKEGFVKKGNRCASVFENMGGIPPANSYVSGNNWYCREGFVKKGNRCASVFENMGGKPPANSYVSGNNWYCKEGFVKKGNRCASVFENMGGKPPANSYVSGNNWYCREGFVKKGNRCASVFENMGESKPRGTIARPPKTAKPSQPTLRASPQKPSIPVAKPKDSTPPTIDIASAITVKRDTPTVRGRVSDSDKVVQVTVEGRAVDLRSDGSFSFSRYVPVGGTTVRIEAIDEWGNRSERTIKITRVLARVAVEPTFSSLDPTTITGRSNPNALALIIGVENYAHAPSAKYADKDALVFSDYARRALGVPQSNIKVLVNEEASRTSVKLALKQWLRGRIKPDSEVYVFFAGHGLASTDGQNLYLLPYDGAPSLLEDTSLHRSELFDVISKAKPRSATVFLDTCYSGLSRGEETLLASLRPVFIAAKQQDIPKGFTVMSAAGGKEFSGSLKEAQQGLFSYFLMKGMEGKADANNDHKITARELQEFVLGKVQRQAIRLARISQTP